MAALVSKAFYNPSPQRINTPPSISSSSSAKPNIVETSSNTFQRFRSSLEQSLRTATRSKKLPSTPYFVEELAALARTAKGKEKAKHKDVEPSHKEKMNIIKRITFRRPAGQDSPSNSTPAQDVQSNGRIAGHTSYITPSLRQASMSSPALHTSSQALPSPKSQSAVPGSSSSNTDVLITPTRQRSRKVNVQTQSPGIGGPVPLGSKHNSSDAPASSSRDPLLSRHRSSKAHQGLPPSPSTPSLLRHPPQERSREPVTPTRTRREVTTPPDTPTPKAQLARHSSKSPTLRASSPIRPKSPSNRVRVVTPPVRVLTSASTSHLPLTSSTPPSTPRRPIHTSRRGSDTLRRPSAESPQHASTIDRGESPSPVRTRTRSPVQPSYSQNRHFNISSGSLVQQTSNPVYRELIRTAASLICKEVLKPPLHMIKTEAGSREWGEVEVRTRALARLERIWNKSGNSGFGSSANVSTAALSSSGLTASGEERERRLFCDALRDGYVLCQIMNKLRSSSVVRPDPRENGFVKTSNVTKFLAACASYGLPNEDLFQRDDLIEATSESLARVAKTVIALFKFVDSPPPSRSKFMSGQATLTHGSPVVSTPYRQASISRASSSTPNLLSNPSSLISSSPTHKRWSPPSDLPTLRSHSPDDNNSIVRADPKLNPVNIYQDIEDSEAEFKPISVPQLKPPPRSPLRRPSTKQHIDRKASSSSNLNARSSVADSTRASFGGASIRDSMNDEPQLNVRQSLASSMLSEATVITAISSIFGGKSSSNPFGTIRTMTTDMTSEAPSVSRAEGNLIMEDLARKRCTELTTGKYGKERKMSEPAPPDLSRVAEETEESISSRGHTTTADKGKARSQEPEKPAFYLRKGKWPEDFIDALKAQTQSQPIPTRDLFPDQDERSSRQSTPTSLSPPRKLAVVRPGNDDPLDSISPLPRRPTHRPRHSIDVPPTIMPKDAVCRGSPDSGRLVPRRHSTKPTASSRNGLIPRISNNNKNNLDDLSPNSDNDSSPVPFPRTTSGGILSSSHPSGETVLQQSEIPRVLRGRFQSEIESSSSSKRRARPSSYDELGAKPIRSRFESMINLGVGSGMASASDLMYRDTSDDSAVRMRLVVRENGKPPTHFQLGNCIGRGQFGSVYRALNLNTGQMVAVKRIRLEGLKEDEVTTLMREVDLVKSLSHPSIVKYEGMARDEDTLNIVLEYAENGSLGQTLKAFGKLNERLVASYVVKILEGLHYLHTSDVVHCDLKAANILTTKNGNVKLSDFGVSLNLRAMEREIKDVAGTPNWMAPEVIELKGASTKSDIWSLGCTVIELLTGRPPYAEITNSMSVMFRIVEDDMPPLPEGCSDLLQDFLAQCFDKDPTRRPSAELLCEHMWLKKNWVELKELRPQDSIPFLRRVSTDFQKSDVVRYLSQLDMSDSSPTSASPKHREDVGMISPSGRRTSHSSIRPLDNDISPREHSFVKTTFSKPMVCRVCLLNVKKNAVLCSQCNLISHTKCAIHSPPTCNLRAQLLLYAQYAEKGNPGSVYSNPADQIHDLTQNVAMSDVPFVEHSRTSIDTPPPQSPVNPDSPEYPPTAFKFMAAFRRSRSNLSPEPVTSCTPPGASSDENDRRRPAVLVKRHERPLSMTSTSTGLSSLRSAATAAESFSSRRNAEQQRSEGPTNDTSTGKRPGLTIGLRKKVSPPSRSEVNEDVRSTERSGALPHESRRNKKQGNKQSGNCTVQ
ncbi:hypothetical protein BYT27DRAFT_7094067 [Phlegmacium glaucopus]|nr:hypothetical protein BYT27DRAFT_7094067 [Phlegmacium glaucopus]